MVKVGSWAQMLRQWRERTLVRPAAVAVLSAFGDGGVEDGCEGELDVLGEEASIAVHGKRKRTQFSDFLIHGRERGLDAMVWEE